MILYGGSEPGESGQVRVGYYLSLLEVFGLQMIFATVATVLTAEVVVNFENFFEVILVGN